MFLGQRPVSGPITSLQYFRGAIEEVAHTQVGADYYRYLEFRLKPLEAQWQKTQSHESLWSEVLAMGGFDILATPLKETEAAYAIGSAWLDWQHEHPRTTKPASMTVSR